MCVYAFRRRDLRGRLVHRQLAATADLAGPAALQDVAVDAVSRRDVFVPDLGRDVLLIGTRREERDDAGVPQRVRGDIVADGREPGPGALPVGLFESRWDHVLRDSVARP